MKTNNRIRKVNRKQSTTLPRVHRSKTRLKGSQLNPMLPSIAETEELLERRHREVNISPMLRLAGMARGEWSNVTVLHFMCEAVAYYATAIRRKILERRKVDEKLTELAEALVIAQQIAKHVAWSGHAVEPEPTTREFDDSPNCIRLIELPGLASRNRVHKVKELLFVMADSLEPFFEVISQEIIEPAGDLERALEMAETLVAAEFVLHRDGCDTEIEKMEEKMKGQSGMRPQTFLQRQAMELKFRVLLQAV